MVKADGEGNQLWSQAYSSGGIDIINYVLESQDGGYILAGWSNFPNDERYNDGWLIKTDAQGKEIWSHNFGDSKDDLIHSIVETGDGGYILVGETISPVNGSYDGWLIKLNPDGQVLWSKSFGGDLQDVFFSVSTTKDGGYIIAGQTQLSDATDFDGWLLKVSSEGQEVWSRTYDTSIGDTLYKALETVDGGFILAGCTGTKDSSGFPCIDDGWVIKTDGQGQEVWSYTFGGKNPDAFNFVAQTDDGGYVLSGWASSTKTGEPTGWLLKLNDKEEAREKN